MVQCVEVKFIDDDGMVKQYEIMNGKDAKLIAEKAEMGHMVNMYPDKEE